MVNHYEIILIYLKKISFTTFAVKAFCEIFIKLKSIFDPLEITYWELLRPCPSIQIILILVIEDMIILLF